MFGTKASPPSCPQTNATISEGAIKHIDALLKDGARARAELQVLREQEKQRQDRDDYRNTVHAVDGCESAAYIGKVASTASLGNQRVMPRLEPYHAEVKAKQKSAGITEKEADTAVRKELLHDAIQSITDYHLRSFLVALLTLI